VIFLDRAGRLVRAKTVPRVFIGLEDGRYRDHLRESLHEVGVMSYENVGQLFIGRGPLEVFEGALDGQPGRESVLGISGGVNVRGSRKNVFEELGVFRSDEEHAFPPLGYSKVR